ncbi:GntR family transcriptional regulator, partial [Acidobacteria bacterium AH-259-O06]|nr:GntR family transcriptional regulator [Acidobacteria bacterium AH-259-O06]
MEKIEGIRFKSLAEAAAEQLRKAIIEGRLKPGERLVEQKMAAALGTSQPTLR